MLPPTLNLSDPAFLLQGVAPVITPETFGPVTRWYDASSLEYLTDGATVSTVDPWDDKSASDDDAFTTVGAEPIFKTAVINGRPTVRFVGARQMVFENGDLALDDFTILCVGLTASDSTYLARSGFNRQIRINWSSQARASWFSGNSGSELVSNQFLSNANQPRMIGHRRDAVNGIFTFFDNATSVSPTTAGVNTSTFGINSIGTLAEANPGINMDIAELVIYNKVLLDSEIQALYYQYFKPKFALP